MAYATDTFSYPHHAPTAPTAHRGILRRLADSMFETRQHKADRDIAAYIARSGGKLTDSVERELMERYSNATFGEPRY